MGPKCQIFQMIGTLGGIFPFVLFCSIFQMSPPLTLFCILIPKKNMGQEITYTCSFELQKNEKNE